jgi:hypothetical protein
MIFSVASRLRYTPSYRVHRTISGSYGSLASDPAGAPQGYDGPEAVHRQLAPGQDQPTGNPANRPHAVVDDPARSEHLRPGRHDGPWPQADLFSLLSLPCSFPAVQFAELEVEQVVAFLAPLDVSRDYVLLLAQLGQGDPAADAGDEDGQPGWDVSPVGG